MAARWSDMPVPPWFDSRVPDSVQPAQAGQPWLHRLTDQAARFSAAKSEFDSPWSHSQCEMGGHRIAAGTARSRKVRPRSSGRPDDKPPRPKKLGGASVARRETRLATATHDSPTSWWDAGDETGYSRRASNLRRVVSQRRPGGGLRWMMRLDRRRLTGRSSHSLATVVQRQDPRPPTS